MLIANRYELGESIGMGGMGEVFRATDTQTGETVAIKALKHEILEHDPDLMQRFVREGQALGKLNHPNIVKILGAFEDNGRNYIVMEYVPGGTLRDQILYQSPLPVEKVLSIALELADALTRAHHLRIIHRDIKPGNVLIAEDGTPRLTDFGVAMMEDMPKMTQTGAMIGTFTYLSPEACRAETIDERTDIWSFGVLLYEMLTGENPFDKRATAATITAILNDVPADVRKLRPDTPPPFAALIQKMLEKERTERIGSVRLVGAELESIIRGMDTPVRAAIGVDTDESRFATPPTNVQALPPEITAAREENPPAEKPLRERQEIRLEIPEIPMPPIPPVPPLPPSPLEDVRKAKAQVQQIKDEIARDVRKRKNVEIHVNRGEHGSTVNLGFIQVRSDPDGEDVRVGPWRFYKGADGSEDINMGFLQVSKSPNGHETVNFNILKGVLIVMGLLVIASLCLIFLGFQF